MHTCTCFDLENEKDPMQHDDMLYLQFGGEEERTNCYTTRVATT